MSKKPKQHGDERHGAEPAAREPKHERGHARVAAILRAAAVAFGEKGYDATTMTEIAARSDTAVASLYHFFPSKGVIADTLLLQYARRALGDLHDLRARQDLRARTGGLSVPDLAGALVDYALGLHSHRQLVLGLIEVRAGAPAKQAAFGRELIAGLSDIVRTALPEVGRERAETMATIILHVLKGVAPANRGTPAARRDLVGEWNALLVAYLTTR